MAAVTQNTGLSVSMKLDAGTDPATGEELEVSTSLRGLNPDAASSNDALLAIVNAATPCLKYDLKRTEKTVTRKLTSST